MNKSLKRKLISTGFVINGKIQALEEGAHSKEAELENSYKPLTKTLKELTTKLRYDVSNIKQEFVKKKAKS